MNYIKTMVEPLGYKYTINIDTELTTASDFEEELLTIRQADNTSIVHFLLSCPGGDVETMKCFLSAIEQSEAHIITEITGDIASAATFLFLAGDELRVSDNAEAMFHFISMGAGGKATDVKRHVDFIHKASERLVKKYYKDFFTESELDSIIEGKEFWMDADEIIERLEIRGKKLQEEDEQNQVDHQALLEEQLFGKPLPLEALEPLDKETLIKVIQGSLTEEEEMELFGDYFYEEYKEEILSEEPVINGVPMFD